MSSVPANTRYKWYFIISSIILLALVIAILLFLRFPQWFEFLPLDTSNQPPSAQDNAPQPLEQDAIDSPPPTSTPPPTAIFQPVELADQQPVDEAYDEIGALLFSMTDGQYQHLFVYHPQYLPLSRLTNGRWNDLHPSFSPDGTKIAYASNQNGQWDIYILDLVEYQLTQVTNTPAYDGSPTWSPDGLWLAYESNQNNNLDVFVQAIGASSDEAIRLTSDPAPDTSPAWSPSGRLIAFMSLRSGDEEIWLADLDQADDRFMNLSQQSDNIDTHPIWSPDGTQLAWSSRADGNQTILAQTIAADTPVQDEPRPIISGMFAVWNPQASQMAAIQPGTLFPTLTMVNANTGMPITTNLPLSGEIHGISWANQNLDQILPLINSAAESTAPASWDETADIQQTIPAKRSGLAGIDVDAPYPYLHDDIDESFEEMRSALSSQLGWDFLAMLENAFLPITNPSDPELLANWLYTGRAIAVNTAPISANWMAIQKEELHGKTYWRVFLRTRYQNGEEGYPLRERVWDFSQRFAGNPEAYENGGELIPPPEGYWIDFTAFAAQYGWERQPALLNWRTYYPGTRYNLFVYQDQLDWEGALLQIYPPEALLPPASNSIVPVRLTPSPEPES
ncbi:MAG: PD40 domain-containing protein [Anaerolineaceae bacterium]|nr:PD40 domain-containing protein [Anaerolineaceae bacterium]